MSNPTQSSFSWKRQTSTPVSYTHLFQCGEDLDESELQLDRLEAEEAAEENDDK